LVGGHFLSSAYADEDGSIGDASAGKHRLDVIYLDVEQFDTNNIFNVVLLGYTRTFSTDMRVGIQTGMAFLSGTPDPDSNATGKSSEHGLSDTIFTFQYDFNERLTASPWIPNTLGFHAQLTAPTGDADEGLSIDAWMLSLGAGWGIEIGRNFWLAPALGFDSTFAENDLAVPTRTLYATVPLIWVSDSGFWVGYAPGFSREFETDEWLYDGLATLGKMFKNGLGLSLDYGRVDRVGSVDIPDDAQLIFNFYYQFGT
jgi:hypothetical protein